VAALAKSSTDSTMRRLVVVNSEFNCPRHEGEEGEIRIKQDVRGFGYIYELFAVGGGGELAEKVCTVVNFVLLVHCLC
jgi:hypothetical protein